MKAALSHAKSVNDVPKTKEQIKDELRKYYLGDIHTLIRQQNENEDIAQSVKFYEWTNCYVFKNPDAQKKQKWIDVKTAKEHIISSFKPVECENDLQKAKMQHAHEEVVTEILEQMEKNEKGKIKLYKGGRFTPVEKTENSNEMKKLEQTEDPNKIDTSPKWIDHGPYPRDVSSLVYNIFIHRINIGLMLDSESIISLDGQKIYVVVLADEGDLRRTAEDSKYTMQMAIGLTDLTSLEPCDIFLRPLRKCDTQHEEIEKIEKELEEYYAVVEGNVAELIKEEPMEYQPESGILGDITEEEWRTYHEYLKIIQEGYAEFKTHTYNRPHMKGVHLRNLAVNAMNKANENRPGKAGRLYNLWERLGVYKAIGAYADFKDIPEKEYLWRRYISDETLRRSIFRDSDRIKLTNIIINKQIHNKMLVERGYLLTEFNFHNEFDLFGTYRFDFHERENEMEAAELELQAQALFQEEIPQGLVKYWKWILPPITKVRNYFGEKIAMYFQFLNFTVMLLIFPSIVGIV